MTLLAPAFLAGLLAIALPLWLHRLSSTNPNRQAFSSLMFLEPGEPRRVLAKKLQYLLLLALRVGLLVLLALLFAEPAWLRSPEAAAAAGAELHVIVLDASASMSHEGRRARAQSAAGEILDDFGPGDFGQIIAAGRAAEVVSEPTADRAVLRRAVSGVRPTAFRVDYGQLMRALDGVLRAAERPVVLHLITDVQQSAMPVRFAELAPSRPALLEIHDVAGDDANWAVESFGGSALTGDLQAQLRSFADEPAEKTVELELNGTTVVERRVTLEPGGRAVVAFEPLDLGPGANRVAVVLEPGDRLAADDRRFLALKRPEPRKVLVVSGGAGGRDDLFVRAALETLDALALDTLAIGVSALAETRLPEFSFVVVTDAGLLGDAEALTRYVEAGGGLLMALGPRSGALSAVPVTGQMLDTGPASAIRTGASLSISAIEATHPAVRGVEGLRTARYLRYVPIVPGDGDTVLAALDNGAPLLIESRLGNGRVLLYTSTLDRLWNDLPVQPVFVPLIAGMADHLLGGAGFSSEAILGSTLSPQLFGLEGGQIFDPNGNRALPLGGGTGDVVLEQPGFYEIVGGGRTEIVAANPDARESDLAAVPAATIERWQALGFRAGEGSEPARRGSMAAVSVSLAPWLLIVLIATVLMESMVGNWHLRVRRGIAT